MAYRHAEDCDGNRVYVGDYVEVMFNGYQSLALGERRRVRAIHPDGAILLRNDSSPVGQSHFNPRNFKLAGRHHPAHKEKIVSKNILYIAVEIGQMSYDQVVEAVNGKNISCLTTVSDTSFEAMKERIRQRIIRYPNERWLILTGHTLAEISAPPVTFRSA